MSTLISNALVTAARDFGEYPSLFELEIEHFSDTMGKHVLEISVYRKGIDLIALIGQLLLILAGPAMFLLNTLVSSQLAIVSSLLILAIGAGLKISRPRLGRAPGRSRTFFVTRNPGSTVP